MSDYMSLSAEVKKIGGQNVRDISNKVEKTAWRVKMKKELTPVFLAWKVGCLCTSLAV